MAAPVFAIVLVGLLLVVKKLGSYIQILRFKRRHGCEPEQKLPQVDRLIGYGLYKTQLRASKNKTILQLNRERYAKHGPTWSATMMGRTFFNTIEPENLKAILATHFEDFGLGTRLEAIGPLLGRGIFTTDGAHWEHSRALIRPNFTRAQVADLDLFENHVQQFIAKIPKDGSSIDLQPLFFQLTLDSATEFLFGDSVNSLSSTPGSEEDIFEKAYDLAQGRLSNRTRMGKLVHVLSDKEFEDACQIVHRYVDRIVYGALDKARRSDVETSADHDEKSSRYVFLAELLKSTRDPVRLRDELLNILLAGRDTTASLLSNTFHVLARRKDIWGKLRAEVDQLGGLRPDYETLKNMKYLKYILNESLRLYPIVPSNARFPNKDLILPLGGGADGQSPLYIPRGSVVAWSTYVMHRRKDIYGPDAEEFRPERWGSKEALRPGWGYLPFNGGPRICVGQQFALAEASYTVVRLVQEFRDIIDRDGTEWVEQLSLTMASGKGVKVTLIPR